MSANNIFVKDGAEAQVKYFTTFFFWRVFFLYFVPFFFLHHHDNEPPKTKQKQSYKQKLTFHKKKNRLWI